MGRKLRGAALRAHKRGKAHADEIVDQKATEVETQEVTQKSNEELFVIDTSGDSKAVVPKKLRESSTKEAHKVKQQAKSSLPSLDQKRVEQLIEKHDPKQLQAMVKEGQAKLRGDRRAVTRSQNRRNKKKGAGKYDLWGTEGETKQGTSPGTDKNHSVSAKQDLKLANAKVDKVLQIGGVKTGVHLAKVTERVSKTPTDTVAVDVAHAGQSYRPDPKAYQAVVQDAVSVELRRQKAEENAKAPLATGMSPETRALLVGDSDTSDDESETEDNNADDTAMALMPKRQDKLTRAERNKQKRLRQERAIQAKERKNKKLLNSVSEIPRFKKEIKKQEKEFQQKKEKIETVKEQSKPKPGKNVLQRQAQQDPIHVPTLPVALEEEHKDSSLRTIKPKGSLVTDRMASFTDRNLVSKRQVGDKKRVRQGKRRKLNVKGKGHEIAKAMDYAMMG